MARKSGKRKKRSRAAAGTRRRGRPCQCKWCCQKSHSICNQNPRRVGHMKDTVDEISDTARMYKQLAKTANTKAQRHWAADRYRSITRRGAKISQRFKRCGITDKVMSFADAANEYWNSRSGQRAKKMGLW